jgi:hypothetical protein
VKKCRETLFSLKSLAQVNPAAAGLTALAGPAAVMGLAVWGGYSLGIAWLGRGLFREIIALAGASFLGMGLYLALISSLKIPELHYLLQALSARRGRSTGG